MNGSITESDGRDVITADPRDRPGHGTGESETVIRPRHGLAAVKLDELWEYRELFLFFVWRDLLIRYKQTVVGIAWGVAQPLAMMVVMVVVFGKLAGFGKSDLGFYAIVAFAGVLPWQFFANATRQAGNSLLMSASMLSKVYFPRMLLPASAVACSMVDLMIAGLILLVLMLAIGIPFHVQLLFMPIFFLAALLLSAGVSLWLSALNVKYRDIKYVMPFGMQLGMLISPVGYASSEIPVDYRLCYSLNPMVGIIDGFRWCILGDAFPMYWPGFVISCIAATILIVSGLIYFRHAERDFADIV